VITIELPEVGARLRPLRHADAGPMAASRSDPTTATFQAWPVPYSLEKAQGVIDEMRDLDGPTPGAWWNLAIADATTNAYLGDVAAKLRADHRGAEIGYTLSPAARGRGLVTVAATRLVELLFESPLCQRVAATLHPDNIASARVVERLGMVFEGLDRQSFWVGDDVSDDARYAMLREDWVAWNTRDTTVPAVVRFVEISHQNVGDVEQLQTHKTQERFVSTVQKSLVDALVPPMEGTHPLVPWFRAIEADGELVGFIMVSDTSPTVAHPYLWRLLIDRRHQGRGIGRLALDQLVALRRSRGDTKLLVSWVPGAGSPADFYRKYGFVPNDNRDDDEIEGELKL
jgi:RimJ/RimL family protein N-acetyltransferase